MQPSNILCVLYKITMKNVTTRTQFSQSFSDYTYLELVIVLPEGLFKPNDTDQGCTNPARHVAVVTKFCTMVPNVYGFSLRNLQQFTLLAPRTLKWRLDF